MLTVFYWVALVCALAVVKAERMPCGEGRLTCSQRSQTALWGNKEYCCGEEFGMQVTSRMVNGTMRTMCECNRMFTETQCMEGKDRCRGASNLMSVGGQTRCCPNGHSMISYHNSVVNGQMINQCRCTKAFGGFGSWGNMGSFYGPMMGNGFQMNQMSWNSPKDQPALRMFHRNFNYGMSSAFMGMQQMFENMQDQMKHYMMSVFPNMWGQSSPMMMNGMFRDNQRGGMWDSMSSFNQGNRGMFNRWDNQYMGRDNQYQDSRFQRQDGQSILPAHLRNQQQQNDYRNQQNRNMMNQQNRNMNQQNSGNQNRNQPRGLPMP